MPFSCNLERVKFVIWERVNSLPNDKILNSIIILKAFVGNKFNVAQMMIFVFDRVEDIWEKGENAGYQFSSLPTMFSKAYSFRSFNPLPHNDGF